MLSKIRNRKKMGFTLIELMIVVAIIGILAAVAVPNFMKFQTKAKQSEVKTNLKAASTALKSKFADTNSYTLLQICTKVSPDGQANASCSIASHIPCGFAPENNNVYWYQGNNTTDRIPATKTGSLAAWAVVAGSSATAGNTNVTSPTLDWKEGGFLVAALANIDSDTMTDGWQIDAGNNLYNAFNGAFSADVGKTNFCIISAAGAEDLNDVVYE